MASLGKYSGAALVESSNDFSPIPAGVYDVEVIESALVPTKAGNGTMLKLQLKVVGAQYENRRIFDQINIENANPQAQEIGQRQLSDLARACGLTVIPDDSDAFHGIPIRARVKIKQDPQYGDKNEVAHYLEADGSPHPASQPAPRQQAATAAPPRANTTPAAGNRPPPSWKRTA
ncbi:MAG: DUF669 domain-containing protein [Proteobacteria bacterium]|nr:DUF669 domain-containing protein [Pseudomonadota bacterium]